MATPLYLWLKDENGTPIAASSEVVGREGSIEVLSVGHAMHAPTDGNTGRLTGTRVHHPLSIEKDIDKSTLFLYRALARGDTLSEGILCWYRVNDAGIETEYFRTIMQGVKVVSIAPVMPNIRRETSKIQNHIERVAFRYESIEWRYLDGNVVFKDAWNQWPH